MEKIILTEENAIIKVLENTTGIADVKAELQKTVNFSSKLEITDFEDKKQFELVKNTKNWYVKTRNTIKRAFKFKRDDYNALAKANLEAEREVISVIEVEEQRLDEMVQKAELLKLRKDNEKVIEDRIEALTKCEVIKEREELLEMKEKDFENLLTESRLTFVKKEEERLEAERQGIAREKELEEAKKQARLEAEQEAQRQAEIEKQKVENEKLEAERKQKEEIERIESEKQQEIERMKREQEAKELAEKQRREDEERQRREAEQEAKTKQERLEKEKEYIAYRDSIEFDKFEKEDGKIVFYKKVWEFKYVN